MSSSAACSALLSTSLRVEAMCWDSAALQGSMRQFAASGATARGVQVEEDTDQAFGARQEIDGPGAERAVLAVQPGARFFIRRHDRVERAEQPHEERPQLPFLPRRIEQVFLGEHPRDRRIAYAEGGGDPGLVQRKGPRGADHCLGEDLAPVRGGMRGGASLRHDFFGKDTPYLFLRKEAGGTMRNGSARERRRAKYKSARSLVMRKSACAASAASRNFWSSGSRQRGNPARCGSGSVASIRCERRRHCAMQAACAAASSLRLCRSYASTR